MESKLLEVSNLEVSYGDIRVLRGISIHLNPAERIGLFGPNGHGKTTLLRSISGLLKPTKGTISFRDMVINDLTPERIVDLGIIHIPQANILFPRMTIYENLILGAYSRGRWSRRNESLDQVFEIFPWMRERRNQKCKTLSGGQRQMAAIGVGLMGRGEVLMLDEPTLGLAPKTKYELRAAIGRIACTGVSMMLVDQDIGFLMEFAHRLYLIEQGKNVLETDRARRLAHSEILDMYFGRHTKNNGTGI